MKRAIYIHFRTCLRSSNMNCALKSFFICGPGFNVETVEYKNVSFTVWDVGGQDKVPQS